VFRNGGGWFSAEEAFASMVVRMPGTTPGRALTTWLGAMGVWLVLSLWAMTGAWPGILIGLAAAAAFAGFVGPLVRLSWQRQAARPVSGRGLEGWAARHLWMSTVLIWAVYLIPVLGIDLLMAVYSRSVPPGGMVVATFSGWFLVAIGFATFWNLALRRQRAHARAAALA
jgi:hypothetical protein